MNFKSAARPFPIPYVLVGVFTWEQSRGFESVHVQELHVVVFNCFPPAVTRDRYTSATHRNEDQVCILDGRVDVSGEKKVLATAWQHNLIQARLHMDVGMEKEA